MVELVLMVVVPGDTYTKIWRVSSPSKAEYKPVRTAIEKKYFIIQMADGSISPQRSALSKTLTDQIAKRLTKITNFQ